MKINDCFFTDKKLLRASEALAKLRAAGMPIVDTEVVPLIEAPGRVLAEALCSDRDLPGFNNSALDGYAINGADVLVKQSTVLPIVGLSTAGHASIVELQSCTAMRILTGAKMPAGADTVVMQEHVSITDKQVTIPAGIEVGGNWRPRGEDVSKGQIVIDSGQRLRAQDIGMAAAVGRAKLSVFKALRVAIFSTGDEIIEPGQPVVEDSVYDVNRYMLMVWLRTMGCLVTDLGILPDQYDVVCNALTHAAQHHDVIITSGGASTGDTDHIADILFEKGSLNFWRLAMKPGRPMAFGEIGMARFIGLPGNPVAVGVCFLRFVYPLLCALSGRQWYEPRSYQLPAAFAMKKTIGRCELVRAKLQQDKGVLSVNKYPKQGSGILSSLTKTDGFIELADEVTQVNKGDLVSFFPVDQFGFL